MSVLNYIAKRGSNRLVIPSAGKMFWSNITKKEKVLCFVLNKGYFETGDLNSMLSILDDVVDIQEFVLIGRVEKVRLQRGSIVYRQRIFFKSLKEMLNFCKSFGLRLEVTEDFHISINNIMNCQKELIYLERYASKFNETIDVWLTTCCLVHLNSLVRSLGMYSTLWDTVNRRLKGKQGYLDRAPFLVCSYSIDKKTSGIYLGLNVLDSRLFSSASDLVNLLEVYGYTDRNVKRDRKGGVFK